VATGRRKASLGRKADPTSETFGISPDGNRLAAWPAVHTTTTWPQDVTLWNVATAQPIASLSLPPNHSSTVRFTFGRGGRLLAARGDMSQAMWDLSTIPPTSLDRLIDDAKKLDNSRSVPELYPLSTPDGSRLIVPKISVGTKSWVVYDAESLALVGESFWDNNAVSQLPLISPDSRWLATPSSLKVGPPAAWEAWLERKLGQTMPWRKSAYYMRFFDLATCVEAPRVSTGENLIGFDADARSVWSYSEFRRGGQSGFRVLQMPVPTGWPPAWLFVVTVAAFAIVVLDWCRSRWRLAGGSAA
jgi:hypothetical protein